MTLLLCLMSVIYSSAGVTSLHAVSHTEEIRMGVCEPTIKSINHKAAFVAAICPALQYTKWRLFFNWPSASACVPVFCIVTKKERGFLYPPTSAAECLKYLTGSALFLGLCSVC